MGGATVGTLVPYGCRMGSQFFPVRVRDKVLEAGEKGGSLMLTAATVGVTAGRSAAEGSAACGSGSDISRVKYQCSAYE